MSLRASASVSVPLPLPLWEELPMDVLGRVFSFLPPDSLARAMCACRHWLVCARTPGPAARPHSPWLLAVSKARSSSFCYARDPAGPGRWRSLPLDFAPEPLRLVAPLGGLLLCKLASSPTLRLALCNPFARQFRRLPDLLTPRSNPAVGVVVGSSPDSCFRVLVAGGSASGSSYDYEATLEVFDSREGAWRVAGPMPLEFAVRLTVWTPSESVHAGDGAVYWMTSARAYSVVGLDVARRAWRELKVPMADQLEWASLVRRTDGRLGLVGGSADGRARVWELVGKGEGEQWRLASVVPEELLGRGFGSTSTSTCTSTARTGWGSTRCVGSDAGELYVLFRELGSDMLVWREKGSGLPSSSSMSSSSSSSEDCCEWNWVEGGSSSICTPVKAVLLRPTLTRLLDS